MLHTLNRQGIKGIEELITSRRNAMLSSSDFYKRLKNMTRPEDFAWCASLYCQSKSFTELLKLRNDRFQHVPHDVFNNHYQEELGHCVMIQNWMTSIGMPDPETTIPTKETEAAISIQFRAAAQFDENLSLIINNSVSEGIAFDFFNQCLAHLRSLGWKNLEYWEIHCMADEEHSDVYHLLSEMNEHELALAMHYVDYTMDTIEAMFRSWR